MIDVMVIEDRILTLEALKSQIPWEEKGLRPIGFYTNCREAMAHLENSVPDVVISDIVMPGMDGLSFCQYINDLRRNIKIIIISAYSKFEYAQRGIKLGVYDFLEKPIDYALLGERIAEAGAQRKHELQVQKIYEDNRSVYQETESGEEAGKKLQDYARFDYFEKRLDKCLECADFDGIDKLMTEMGGYIEKQRIGRAYLLFFITNFLSVRTELLSAAKRVPKTDDLSALRQWETVLDILDYFREILQDICREKRKNSGTDNEDVVEKIRRFLLEHYKDGKIGLTDIAKAFNISPNYLCRIFKEKTGITLMNYIQELRIQEAKRLLVETDKKMWAISQELGYSNQYHFSMGFKKATGYSPKQYRNLSGLQSERRAGAETEEQEGAAAKGKSRREHGSGL